MVEGPGRQRRRERGLGPVAGPAGVVASAAGTVSLSLQGEGRRGREQGGPARSWVRRKLRSREAVAGDIGRGVEISGVAKVGGVLGGRPRRQVALRAETADLPGVRAGRLRGGGGGAMASG